MNNYFLVSFFIFNISARLFRPCTQIPPFLVDALPRRGCEAQPAVPVASLIRLALCVPSMSGYLYPSRVLDGGAAGATSDVPHEGNLFISLSCYVPLFPLLLLCLVTLME